MGIDQLGVELHLDAETGAVRAGAVGGVEGEVARLDLTEGDAVRRGRQKCSEKRRSSSPSMIEAQDAATELQRGLYGLGDAAGDEAVLGSESMPPAASSPISERAFSASVGR